MPESFQEQVAGLRRAQILEAATRVFAERGFHRTTIRDVARAAGVADGTIYNYFENKTALLLGVLDPLNERERHMAGPPPDLPNDVRELFRLLFAQRLRAFDGPNLPALQVVLSEALVNAELRALFVERVIAPTLTLAEPMLERLIAAGKLRPVDVPLTIRTVTATLLGLLMLRLMGDQPLQEHWDALPDLLAELLVNGLDTR